MLGRPRRPGRLGPAQGVKKGQVNAQSGARAPGRRQVLGTAVSPNKSNITLAVCRDFEERHVVCPMIAQRQIECRVERYHSAFIGLLADQDDLAGFIAIPETTPAIWQSQLRNQRVQARLVMRLRRFTGATTVQRANPKKPCGFGNALVVLVPFSTAKAAHGRARTTTADSHAQCACSVCVDHH